MALVGAAWSAALLAQLSGNGYLGSKLSDFASAIGNGSALYLVGQTFSTSDTGLTPGAGIGSGIGITGIVATQAASNIYADCVAKFGQAGSELFNFCTAIGTVLASQLLLATLASVDAPVYAGTGTITTGSFSVVGSGWGSNIKSQAPSFEGSQWGNFTDALGSGCATELQADGTGSLIVAGAAPPTPIPGVGVGTGTLS